MARLRFKAVPTVVEIFCVRVYSLWLSSLHQFVVIICLYSYIPTLCKFFKSIHKSCKKDIRLLLLSFCILKGNDCFNNTTITVYHQKYRKPLRSIWHPQYRFSK